MKTRILFVITVLAAAEISAVGQGYFLFTANKNSVYDGSLGSGIPTAGGPRAIAAFLWGPAATVGLLGPSGTSSNNANIDVAEAWMNILTDPQFHFATNATAGALAAVHVNASGLAIGGISYLGGSTFTVAGTVGGQVYTIYCIAWWDLYATPWEAAANNSGIGWSNPFQYASGATVASPILGFSSSGMQAFLVGTPEPATSTLVGLGAATALLIHRRRRSKRQT